MIGRFFLILCLAFFSRDLYGSAEGARVFSLAFELPIEFISQKVATIADRSYHTIRNIEFDRYRYREGIGDITIHGEDYRHIPIHGPEEYPDINGHIYKSTLRNQIIVAFHGSHWTDEWIQNFKFGMIDATDHLGHRGNVHKGFLNMSRRVFPRFKESLEKLLGEDGRKEEAFEYTFTGHSLGGALGIINATFLARGNAPLE